MSDDLNVGFGIIPNASLIWRWTRGMEIEATMNNVMLGMSIYIKEGNTPESTKRKGWSVQIRSMQDFDPSSRI